MKNLFKLFILIVVSISSLNVNAQHSKSSSTILLFIDEPLPAGSQKISSKKIQTIAASDYFKFQKNIEKHLQKAGGNLARLDTYETPTPNHGHRAMVSLYKVNNFDSVERAVLHRRDSVDKLLNSTKEDSITLNFIRFKLPNKLSFDVLINGRFLAEMTQLSTAHTELTATKSITITGKGNLILPNSASFSLTPGGTYYIECILISGGLSVTPIFSILPGSPGRFMYSFIQKNKDQ